MVGADPEYSTNGCQRKRVTPCKECKFHRRKCVRNDDNAKCERCIRLKRQCINASRKSESEYDKSIEGEVSYDGATDDTIIGYYQQLYKLQDQFHTLETALTQAKISSKLEYSISSFDSSSSSSSESTSQLSPLSPDNETDSSEQQLVHRNGQRNRASSNLTQSWTLSMTKNGLTLNTNIQNVQDFLTFGMQAVQYLDGISIYNEPSNGTTLLSLFARNRANNINYIFQQALKKNADQGVPTVASVSPSLIFDKETVISTLVHAYFTCFNVSHPFMTQRLYYSRFHNSEDILSSPVTAAMCLVMTMRPCPHIPYDIQELRQIGEYFFIVTRDALSDIIDDPARSTEATVGFLLLSHYAFYTLRFSEARNYSSTAYLISHNAVGHIKEIDNTDAEEIIMKRLHFMLSLQESALKNFLGGGTDTFDLEIFKTKLESLPDDSDIARSFVKLGSRVLNLLRSQHLLRTLRQLHCAHSGEVTELSIDAFLRLQHLIQTWWEGTPLEDRIFQHPLGLNAENGDFYKVHRSYQFMPLIAFHAFQIGIHSCFISDDSPYLHQEKQSMYHEQAGAIHYQSMRICLTSSKIMIGISERIMQLDDICRFDNDFLLNILETLAVLTASSDPFIAKEATILIKKCFALIRRTLFQEMTQVPDKLVIGGKPKQPYLVTLPTYDNTNSSPTLNIMWNAMTRSLSELGIHFE